MNRIVITLACLLMVCCFACTPDSEEQATSSGPTYQEQHRPQLHFTPPTQWMNDPNGMVFYAGEYHLFYQHYPDSNVWGPMHWGHAVSTDLMHWEHLPIALYPESLGYIFSGSAVIDWNNTSGFGENGEPPMIAIFTHHLMEGEQADRNDFQYQSIAYSTDMGRSWTKYEGNPVIPNPGIRDFRDPKVIWDGDSRQWIMVLAAQDRIRIYGSPNLKNWRYLSEFGQQWGAHGGVWECPDLFPMELSATGQRKWVLLVSINPGGPNGGSATQYFIGDFDGRRFTLDAEFEPFLNREKVVWLDHGRDNYAGVTWSDIPPSDGRRIFMGWMSNWDYARDVPTTVWRSAMTLPRTLELDHTPVGPLLRSSFAQEVDQQRAAPVEVQLEGQQTESVTIDADPRLLELSFEAAVATDAATRFGFELSNETGDRYRFGYDAEKDSYFSDRQGSGKTAFSEKFANDIHWAARYVGGTIVSFRAILDVSGLELIADDGLVTISDLFFPTEDFTQIRFFVEGDAVDVNHLEMYTLQSVW